MVSKSLQKAGKAAKAQRRSTRTHKSAVRTKVHFFRKKTLELQRNPKYRRSKLGGRLLDPGGIIIFVERVAALRERVPIEPSTNAHEGSADHRRRQTR